MIMTFQNPLDWASEAFYDSEENENSELERDPEIIFKTYLKEFGFSNFFQNFFKKISKFLNPINFFLFLRKMS